MPMQLNEFIRIFGGEVNKDYDEIQNGVIKLREKLDDQVRDFLYNIPKNKKFMQKNPEIRGSQLETYINDITVEQQMQISTLYHKHVITSMIHMQKNNVNPLLYFIPDVFLNGSPIEKLQDYGNAMDKFLFSDWIFFRQFFIRQGKCKFDVNKIILDCVNIEKINKLINLNKEFIVDYKSYENLTHSSVKQAAQLYQERINRVMTVLKEYTRQFCNVDNMVLSAVCEILVQCPCIIFDVITDSIKYVLQFIDMQDYLIEDINLTLQTPQAIISSQHDPCLMQVFRKQKQDEKQMKIQQYNYIVSNLPAWDVLNDLNNGKEGPLKYFQFKPHIYQKDVKFDNGVQKIDDKWVPK